MVSPRRNTSKNNINKSNRIVVVFIVSYVVLSSSFSAFSTWDISLLSLSHFYVVAETTLDSDGGVTNGAFDGECSAKEDGTTCSSSLLSKSGGRATTSGSKRSAGSERVVLPEVVDEHDENSIPTNAGDGDRDNSAQYGTVTVMEDDAVVVEVSKHLDAKEHEQEATETVECMDEHKLCGFWADEGECDVNPGYMLYHCRKSCGTCRTLSPIVERRTGERREERFGVVQMAEGDQADKTIKVIESSVEYMENEVFAKSKYDKVRDECRNREKLCAFWVAIGECQANAAYMTIHCAPSCQTCHLIDFEERCPLDPNAKDAFVAGDLNKMFERIVEPGSEFAKYKPVVHSRPPLAENDRQSETVMPDYQIGPWIITFDEFITDEESDRLIELGYNAGYDRSTDVGERLFDGTYDELKNEGRTSKNAWCLKECQSDPLTQQVVDRISRVTGIPSTNYEDFQILRYEEGQRYQLHHDYIPHQVKRQCGPRILTFFLYLSDVEGGGGTAFPDLRPKNLTIMPKKGKALLWPSVLNSNPNSMDARTHHEALRVEKGVKYAANAWIHLRDFVSANEKGCA